eukprot:PhF_6_TR36563/c0_g1_i1/m.53987
MLSILSFFILVVQHFIETQGSTRYAPTKVTTLAGNDALPPGYLDGIGTQSLLSPRSIAVVDKFVFVAEPGNARIRRVSLQTREVETIVGNGTQQNVDASVRSIQAPTMIAASPKTPTALYVLTDLNTKSSLRKITLFNMVGVQPMISDALFEVSMRATSPLAVSSIGYVYAGMETMVGVYKGGSTAITYAGSQTQSGYNNAGLLASLFMNITAMSIDAQDNLYVADNYRIRKITTTAVTTVAGTGTPGFADGLALTAQFSNIGAMVISMQGGTLYFADVYRIRFMVSNQVVTMAGSTTAGVNVDGPVGGATFATIFSLGLGLDETVLVVSTAAVIRLVELVSTHMMTDSKSVERSADAGRSNSASVTRTMSPSFEMTASRSTTPSFSPHVSSRTLSGTDTLSSSVLESHATSTITQVQSEIVSISLTGSKGTPSRSSMLSMSRTPTKTLSPSRTFSPSVTKTFGSSVSPSRGTKEEQSLRTFSVSKSRTSSPSVSKTFGSSVSLSKSLSTFGEVRLSKLLTRTKHRSPTRRTQTLGFEKTAPKSASLQTLQFPGLFSSTISRSLSLSMFSSTAVEQLDSNATATKSAAAQEPLPQPPLFQPLPLTTPFENRRNAITGAKTMAAIGIVNSPASVMLAGQLASFARLQDCNRGVSQSLDYAEHPTHLQISTDANPPKEDQFVGCIVANPMVIGTVWGLAHIISQFRPEQGRFLFSIALRVHLFLIPGTITAALHVVTLLHGVVRVGGAFVFSINIMCIVYMGYVIVAKLK